MDLMRMRQSIGSSLIRAGELILPDHRDRNVGSILQFTNPFVAQLVRKGRVIQTVRGLNGVTIVGKNSFLDTMFKGTSAQPAQVNPWYIGLINNSPTPVLDEADTLASHTGWTEWTSYSGNRKSWAATDAANKIKGTNAVSSFTINAAGTLFGILVASVASGTSGLLWATGGFDTTLGVVNTDVINITYGIKL